MKDYFRCVNCYPLPNPGRNVEYAKFNGDKKDINNKFIELLYDYIFVLFDKNRVVSKFENSVELLRLFKALCDRTLNQARINVDEFYRLITENKDYKIINKFKSNYLNPLKSSYLGFSSLEQLEMRINTIRSEYRSVERSVYDQSKLGNIHFEYEMSNMKNKLKEKLERERIEEERRRELQRQQELQEQQRRMLAQQQAEEEKRGIECEELRYKVQHPPPPVYIYDSDSDDDFCRIM